MRKDMPIPWMLASVETVGETEAEVIDSFGRGHTVKLLPRRGAGPLPRAGETWVLDRTLNDWTFSAVFEPVLPEVTDVAPGPVVNLLDTMKAMGLIDHAITSFGVDDLAPGTLTGDLTVEGAVNVTVGPIELTSSLGSPALRMRLWDAADTDIDSNVPGSTFGSIIEGRLSGHLVVGIRGNDNSDGFHVIGPASDYSTEGVYGKPAIMSVFQDGTTWLTGSTGGLLRLRDPDATFPDPIDTWIGFYGSDDQRLGWIGSSSGDNRLYVRAEAASEGIALSAGGGGTIVSGGELIVSEVGSSAHVRMINGNYGAFWRNDGVSMHLLLTASGDQYGSWNTLRPFYVDLVTGNVTMNHDVTIGGTVYAPVGTTTVPTYTFTGDTDTGFTRSGTNQVSIVTGGSESFRVDSAQSLVPDGSVTVPSLAFISDQDTGIYKYGTNALAFTSGGVRAFHIDASANMIGNNMAMAGINYIRAANGSAGAPTYEFTNDTDTGMYLVSAGILGFSSAGTLGFAQNNNSLYANNNSGSLSTSTPRIVINHSANYLIISRDGSAGIYVMRQTSDGRVAEWYRTTTLVGSVSVLAASTNYNTTSDYRLKENVSDLTGSMDLIRRMRPVWHTWIEHPYEGINGGFIAHELQEVYPRAVTGVKDAVNEDGSIDPQEVDHSKLVPLLVAAIKEQDARIAALEAVA